MPVDCPEKLTNEETCPCASVDCERHGICCLCIRSHKENLNNPLPACLRGQG